MAVKLDARTALLGLAALLGVVAAAFAVQLYTEARRLDDSLAEAQQRNDRLEATLTESEAAIERGRQEIAAAAALRRRAAETAAREALFRQQAERQRLSAEEEAEFARLETEAAREAAEDARLEAEAERKRRESEWGRLERALGATAPTSRDGWTLTVRLENMQFDNARPEKTAGEPGGAGFGRRTRERLSRIAGAFLAHQGYRIRVLGGGDGRGRAVERYLEGAGLPAELVETGSRTGELRLEVLETIFGKA